MNKFYRILSVVLVFAMCFSLAPVSALALDLPELDILEDVVTAVEEEEAPVEEVPAEEEVEEPVEEPEPEQEPEAEVKDPIESSEEEIKAEEEPVGEESSESEDFEIDESDITVEYTAPVLHASRIAVVNPNGVTGKNIITEARKWSSYDNDDDYWSGSMGDYGAPAIAWRTGYTTSNHTYVSFDCSGFVCRVLNDLGLRGESAKDDYSCVLRDKYGSNFISSDSRYLGQCYAEDISAAVQKAKNKDYSDLQLGDVLYWYGASVPGLSENHYLFYAGLNVSGQPTTIEFTGSGYRERVIPDNYWKAIQSGTRFVESFQYTESWPCDLTFEIKTSCNAWTMPGSDSTYPDSEKVTSSKLAVGTKLVATEIYENTAAGHYWYKTTVNGEPAYVYVPYTKNATQNWNVSVSGVKKPTEVKLTDSFNIGGIVKTGGGLINSIRAFVYPGTTYQGGAYVICSEPVNPNSTTYDLSKETNSTLKFGGIPSTGYYTYIVHTILKSYTLNGYDVPTAETKVVILDDTKSYFQVVNKTSTVTKYTVTFNANGGSCSETSRTVTSGNTVGTLPTPTRSGYVFQGWYTASTGGTKVTSSTKVTANTTLYAHWAAESGLISSSHSTVTIDLRNETSAVITFTCSGNLPERYTIWYEFENGNLDAASAKWAEGGWDKTTSLTLTGHTAGQVTLKIWLTNTDTEAVYDTIYIPVTIIDDSGWCGDSLQWEMYFGWELDIYGSGPMWDYSLGNRPSYETFRDDIMYVWLQGGSYVGAYAFYGYTALECVDMADSITAIGERAFSDCYNLDGELKYIITDNVTEIGRYAFSNTAITKAEIPWGVTIIEDGVFAWCVNLEEAIVPTSVYYISDSAFYDCKRMTAITIPSTVTDIGAHAFYMCDSLTDVYFDGTPAQWAALEANAGDGNEDLFNATVHFTNTYTVTFVPMNGTDGASGEITQYELVVGTGLDASAIPSVSREGYTFDGWYTASTDGDLIMEWDMYEYTRQLSRDLYLYAHWTANTYAVTFVPMNGTDGASGEITQYELAVGTGLDASNIPAVTRDGYSFDGWFTASVDGEQITESNVYEYTKQRSANLYLYAQWTHQNHNYSSTIVEAATCEKDGLKTYICLVCGDGYEEVLAATGHTIVKDAAVEPTCTKTGLTEGKHCSVCEKVTVAQKEVSATGHKEVTDAAVAATCTKTGLTEGKHCSVCGTVTVAQKDVSATGHKTELRNAAEATCTKGGYTGDLVCTVCGKTTAYGQEVAATGHKEVTDAAVAATCTKTGLTEGKHCSICGTVTVAQKTVAKIAHTWNSGKVTKEPALNVDGVKTYTCTACGGTKTEKISAISADINSDGTSNAFDLVALMKHIVGVETAKNTSALDVNKDGKTDILDVIRLARYLAG